MPPVELGEFESLSECLLKLGIDVNACCPATAVADVKAVGSTGITKPLLLVGKLLPDSSGGCGVIVRHFSSGRRTNEHAGLLKFEAEDVRIVVEL
jgi:hypothetical protein